MAVTLDPCARTILCTLSVSALNALDALVGSYITQARAELSSLTAQLALLQVQLIPINAARTAANAALSTISSAALLLPLELIEGCGDLGDLNRDVHALFANARADVNDVLDDANRKLSLSEELNALIADLTAQIDRYEAFRLVLQDCIAQGGQGGG